MAMIEHGESISKETALSYLVQILTEITAELGIGEIRGEIRLGNLGIESVNLAYLIAEVQQQYGLRDMLVRKLRDQAIPLVDLTVENIATLVGQASSEIRQEVADHGR